MQRIWLSGGISRSPLQIRSVFLYYHQKSPLTITGDSRLAAEIHRVREEIGDEFKYPPYLTVSTEWMAVGTETTGEGGWL